MPPDLAPPFLLNYRGVLGSSLPCQLPFFVDVPDVQADGIRDLVKEVGHLSLAEPDRFVVQLDFQASFPVVGVIEDDIHQFTFRLKRCCCLGRGGVSVCGVGAGSST